MADNPHDRLFKLALRQTDNARAYLSAILPASVIAGLDLSGLECEPTDLVSERLRELFSDLVYKIPLAEDDAYICTLLEHQSTAEPMMPFRFLKAVVSIWTDLLQNEPARTRLPPILSILVHNGEQPWCSPRTLWQLYGPGAQLLAPLRECLPELRYLVDDLRAESAEGLGSRLVPPYLRLALMSLRSRGEDPPDPQLPTWAESFRALWQTGNETAVEAILSYHARMAGERGSRIIDAAVAADPGIKENYVTLYERILREGEARGIEKGIEQGIEKGIEKGIERGEALVVERLLRLKFGELPADVRARLAHAKSTELERWAERILFADSLAAVFEGPTDDQV